MKICTTEKNKKILRQAAVILFWTGLWQLLAMLIDNRLLLPSVADTLKTLAGLAGEGEFYLNMGWTFLRCVLSMALSFAAGTAAAWLAYRFEAARSFLTLPVGFFKAVPVMAVIIYVILLAEADWVAVVVCFLMCFPVVYTNVLSGLDSMDRELLELVQVYELTAFQKIKHIYFPGIMPQLKAAVKLIAGLSWKAVVAAEVLSIPRYSLGYEMINAKYYMETATLFSYILVIVVLSLAMEKLIDCGLKRWSFRAYKGSRLIKTDKRVAEAVAVNKPFADVSDKYRDASGECRDVSGEYRGFLDFERPAGVLLRGLYKSFGKKTVLEDMNMEFKAGEVTALTGRSGRGKTTLARIIAGLEKADRGYVSAVYASGCESFSAAGGETGGTVNTIRTGETAKAGGAGNIGGEADIDGKAKISYLFQEDRLIPWLNVFDNIAVSTMRDGGALEAEIKAMAEALEISDSLWKLPEELSGGMRHRVALGRTFIADSELMILDEPFRGLDEKLKTRITDRLWKSATSGKTVIMITHSKEDAEALSDRIIEQ